MERRQVFGLIISPLVALGGIGLVTSLNVSDHAEVLRVAGVGSICLAGAAWISLLVTAERKNAAIEESGFISVPDAGDWLYKRGSQTLRKWLNRFVPDTFNSVRDHATHQIHAAATEGQCTLYERKAPGLPLEEVPVADCDPAMLMESESASMAQVFMKRNALKKVLKFTEGAIASQVALLSH